MDLGLLLHNTEIQQDKKDKPEPDGGLSDRKLPDGKLPGGGLSDEALSSQTQVNFSQEPEVIEPVKDKNERFKKPWNKLEKGMKMNRLLLFIEKEVEDNELSPELRKDLKNTLFKACDGGLFNKLSEVSYDVEEASINSIKSLEFNSETKRYKVRSGSSKHRSTSKSKSNIDRLLKPKARTK